MCTLTWQRDPEGALSVHFNRDERKTRPIAEPPILCEEDGVSFLSPRDPLGGGTWMLANELGLVVCLLNRWELKGRSIDHPQSRGQLVWSLASLKSPHQVADRLLDLHDYQGFTLVVFSKKGDRSFEWDGVKLQSMEVPDFLTSSSFQFEEVFRARMESYRSHPRGAEFHASPLEMPSAYTVRMNRPDAQTWSRSTIEVTDRVRWHYLAEQPDLAGDPKETRVEMRLV
ncbi:MAG: NRDE family protein [Akkermansiaceae bacterium]